jgi:hypothetical protein
MKGLTSFVFAVLIVVFMPNLFWGNAEAARVAVVPIQIDDTKVARSADFTGYYWDIMIDKLRYPDYELLDDEKVEEVIPEGGLKSFDQVTLQDICNRTDSEIVIAMRLDEVRKKPDRSNREPRMKFYMKGEFAGYNRLTGRCYNKKVNSSGSMEMALTYRNDWLKDAFASTLKRCLNHMLKDNIKK